MSKQDDKTPVRDTAEDDAYFPSPFSLTQYVTAKTDFDGADYPNKYTGGKWKILMIGTQERYLKMADGKFFSTGNHPVEMLLPMYHLDAAGFDIDVATLSGDPVKLEMWAFPKEDEAVKSIYDKYKQKLRSPLNLSEVWDGKDGKGFDQDTPYLAVFIPGGHGVLNGIPFSKTVGDVLRWAHANDRFFITLCHGPASILAADIGKPDGSKFIYEGYSIDVFPDSLDQGANIDIGYIPGKMEWLVGERLKKLGVTPINKTISGECHKDRLLLTGDSPLASNNLGKLAAKTLLEEVNNGEMRGMELPTDLNPSEYPMNASVGAIKSKQKVSSACERCRKRKLGCDAERPCVHCIRAGAQCIPRKSTLGDISASSASQTDSRNRQAQTPGSPILPESSIVDLSTLMIRGSGSSQHLRHDTSSLPGGTKLLEANTTLSAKHWRNVVGVELPAEHILEDLVDSFFSSVNWFMMVFHEDTFRLRYTEMLQQAQIKYQDTTFYWTWLLVIALGAHYAALKDPDDQMSPQYRHLSRDLVAVIETRFLQIIGCQTVETVQICICGMGVKIAQVIGLHRESFWRETSPLAREVKRRTWWTLEVFDKLTRAFVNRYAAVAFGRPCIIDDSDCQVEMISDIDIGGRVHVPARPLILYHQHKFRLYRIMGAFLGRKRQRNSFESVETIHQRMLQWRHELPAILTLSGQEQSMDPSVVRPTEIHALSLQLTYDNLQIILHRTAVFNNIKDISDISPKSSTSLQQIFTSAIDTSELSRHPHILDACRRTHADVHIGMTMFTAGVVLCAICLSQPLTEMGSRAKMAVMHITRMCRETTAGFYSGQLVSEQSLGIIDSLVEVMLRKETDMITGRTNYPDLHTTPAKRDTGSSIHGGPRANRTIAPRPSIAAGPSEPRHERVLEPIQEVFRQHISTPSAGANLEPQSSVTGNNENDGVQGAVGTFNWDGDMSALVDSGLVDASQLWLWADALDFDSFNDPAGE
ncbi:transcriptional regulatory [Fusarium acutatum]|uniref:Transcriptional regulatory n=1 Tax=Fusarium acutatum TaxID=78861 RepID=A0A8H4NHX1_9HYPO|nr:transcriptional regulatory [Fusarium acutatum]